MKAIALVPLLLLSVSGWAGTAPAEYSVNVHVSSDRFISDCSGGIKVCVFTLQLLQVVIDGKKYELQADATKQGLLPIGDYNARPVQIKRLKGLAAYEFLLPDNTTEQFTVVGQSE